MRQIPSDIISSGMSAKLIEKYAPDKALKILDLGCGNGQFLRILSGKGYRNISGIDLESYGEDLSAFDFRKGDAASEQLLWPDNYFDVAISWEVLEHVENPRFAAREVYRVLKPKGIFMFSVPNAFHIMSRLFFFRKGDLIRWSGKNDHYNIFTRKVFKKIFLNHFDLLEELYAVPTVAQGLSGFWQRLKFLDKFLPETELFSNFNAYVLKSKKEAI